MSVGKVAIVSTAHWQGDARLRRHARYLERAGFEVRLTSFASSRRLLALGRAVAWIWRTDAGVVVMPDPELFALGGLAARLSRKSAVIDIHEDYASVAAGREWIPSAARPLVGLIAAIAVGVGRMVASRVVVAAPELAKTGDIVVRNIPEPGSLPDSDESHSRQVVYVGDVTVARGALEMARLIALLPDDLRIVLIGNVAPEARLAMTDDSASGDGNTRLVLVGRLNHETAWRRAEGSVAGLCLLRPLPAYRQAVATKIWEYMAAGIPPVVSDLPGQRRLVARIHPDLVCESVSAVAAVITRLSKDVSFREQLVMRGRELYLEAWEESRPDLALQSAMAP